ncbi:hypothetical protein ACFWIN_26305, partial [Streptomyces sp. NPDC127049]
TRGGPAPPTPGGRSPPPFNGRGHLPALDLPPRGAPPRLVFFTPPPGTDTADRLALLAVVGTDQFTP